MNSKVTNVTAKLKINTHRNLQPKCKNKGSHVTVKLHSSCLIKVQVLVHFFDKYLNIVTHKIIV